MFEYWGTWGQYSKQFCAVPSTVDNGYTSIHGGLYTGLCRYILDNSPQARESLESETVHSVGKVGYIFGNVGTPSSTALKAHQKISFSFLLLF